jgi:hypothetical protein
VLCDRVEAGGVNVLIEAAEIITSHAESLRDGESIRGEFAGTEAVRLEIENMERVALLLRVAAMTLGVA